MVFYVVEVPGDMFSVQIKLWLCCLLVIVFLKSISIGVHISVLTYPGWRGSCLRYYGYGVLFLYCS